MHPQLPLAEYQFTYQAQAPITLPELSGTLWHSVLGKALRELSCTTGLSQCDNCPQIKACDYSRLFSSIPSEPSDLLKNYRNIPTPHLFRYETNELQKIATGQSFTIKIILIGSASEKLSLLIKAMQRAGENGFNRERHKARLLQVVQKTPYGIERGILLDNNPAQQGLAMLYPILKPLKQVRLHFKTPYRQTGKAANSPHFLLDHFIMTLIRRISQLQYFHAQAKLDTDFIYLKQLAQSLPSNNQKIKKSRFKSLRKRKNQHQQTAGWIGYIDINLQNHQALWEYLYLGQWLNVGKNASMGFGQYQLIDLG